MSNSLDLERTATAIMPRMVVSRAEICMLIDRAGWWVGCCCCLVVIELLLMSNELAEGVAASIYAVLLVVTRALLLSRIMISGTIQYQP